MAIYLSTTYFGPIQYYSKLAQSKEIIIERVEHFPKQTFRNRCNICCANGIQTLSVPISKGNEIKVFTKDVKIDYSMNWQANHIRTMESAYRNSPFYLYYSDDILLALKKKYQFLYDLNLETTRVLCQLMGIPFKPWESAEYIKVVPSGSFDFRDHIHPKPRMYRADEQFFAPTYRQVFEPVYGFIPNASILDLLFNTGPDSRSLLASSHP